MPDRIWVDGQTVNAQDFNDFVQEQVNTSCTSGTRPPSPNTGRRIYESDTTRFQVWDGTGWRTEGWTGTTGRVGVKLRRAAVQSLPSLILTPITWDTEDFDGGNFITPPSSNVNVPAGQGGLYAITAAVFWASSPTAGAYTEIFNFNSGVTWTFAHSNVSKSAASVHVDLTAGDVIQVRAFNVLGSAVDVTARLELYRMAR